jgi:hypothetical protein
VLAVRDLRKGRAAAAASALAAARPMPLFAPVTITLRPDMSGMSFLANPAISERLRAPPASRTEEGVDVVDHALGLVDEEQVATSSDDA